MALHDLLASHHEAVAIEVFCQLSGHRLLTSIILVLLNQHNIGKLIDILQKFLVHHNLVLQARLKLLFDLLNLLFHLLLVVIYVDYLTIDLVLLLPMDFLQLFETKVHRCQLRLHFKKLFCGRKSDLVFRFHLVLKFEEGVLSDVFRQHGVSIELDEARLTL